MIRCEIVLARTVVSLERGGGVWHDAPRGTWWLHRRCQITGILGRNLRETGAFLPSPRSYTAFLLLQFNTEGSDLVCLQ
jgi:hypothetical protein